MSLVAESKCHLPHDWYHERPRTCVLRILFNLDQYVTKVKCISYKAWHEVMTLTLSPYNGDVYSVHLLTEETILVYQI